VGACRDEHVDAVQTGRQQVDHVALGIGELPVPRDAVLGQDRCVHDGLPIG
jgi:hypothetical protein